MASVRQKIDALFDYRGDIARNAGSTGPRVYSADYSPNNIRRVVISPNGVLVVYHKSCQGTNGRSFNSVEVQEMALYQEESDPKYKPILSMLADTLICASVEEIIVLSNSLSGRVDQNYMNEIRLDMMVRSYKGAGTSLEERIMNRFRRLRYYTVVNCNFKEFLSFFRTVMQNGEMRKHDFISEIPAIQQRAKPKTLAGPDYWKYNGCKGNYQFDTVLKAHFDEIARKREQADKDKAVEAVREKRLGGKIEVVNDLIETYIACNSVWSTFYSICQKEGTNGVLPNLSFVEPPVVVQVLPFKGMAKVPDKLLSKQPCSETEALEKDEAMLKTYKARCAKALAMALLRGLDSVKVEPVLLKTMLYDCETTVCVPPDCSSVAAGVQAVSGVVFDGRDLQASIINCCWQFMQYFVACEHPVTFTRSYWENKLRRSVAKA